MRMGLLDWLHRAEKAEQRGERHQVLEFNGHEEEFLGLNMRLAIEAHLKWKERLEKALAGSSGEHLEVGVVAADDRCALGQWLHGEARRQFVQHPEYIALVKAHSEFHLLAGDILCDAHDGKLDEARDKLRSSFRQKSDRVQLALVRLYSRSRA